MTATTPNMGASDAIRGAVEACIPEMARQHADWMRAQVSRFSPLSLLERRKLSSAHGAEGGAYRAISRYMGCSDDALLSIATKAAKESAESIIAKLTRKLGSITNADMPHHNGDEFTLTGLLGNRRVCVRQQRVFKISAKGTPFYQWPARIYVDGSFVSEASFSKLCDEA